MEKDNTGSVTKKNFVNIFTQLTNIYFETKGEVNQNYEKGKKEALDEIIQWYNNTYNNDKAVSINALILFLQEKIENTKIQMSIKKENDIKPIFDINAIKKNYGSSLDDMA